SVDHKWMCNPPCGAKLSVARNCQPGNCNVVDVSSPVAWPHALGWYAGCGNHPVPYSAGSHHRKPSPAEVQREQVLSRLRCAWDGLYSLAGRGGNIACERCPQ